MKDSEREIANTGILVGIEKLLREGRKYGFRVIHAVDPKEVVY